MIRDGIGRLGGHFRTEGRFDTRDADRMRPHIEAILQVPDMLMHREHFKLPVIQSEEHPDTDIVDACFHGPVHDIQPPVKILFGSRRMDLGVGFPVICFLE